MNGEINLVVAMFCTFVAGRSALLSNKSFADRVSFYGFLFVAFVNATVVFMHLN